MAWSMRAFDSFAMQFEQHFTWFKEHCRGPALFILFLFSSRERVLSFSLFSPDYCSFSQFSAFLFAFDATSHLEARWIVYSQMQIRHHSLCSAKYLQSWVCSYCLKKKIIIIMFCLLDRFSMCRNVVQKWFWIKCNAKWLVLVLRTPQTHSWCFFFVCWKTTSESHLGFSHGIGDSDIQSFHRRSAAEMLRVKYWSYFAKWHSQTESYQINP